MGQIFDPGEQARSDLRVLGAGAPELQTWVAGLMQFVPHRA